MLQRFKKYNWLRAETFIGHDFNPKYICLKCYIYPFTDQPHDYIICNTPSILYN
jgi:hypothetical protein